jgi:hypothetical protein
MGFLLFVLFFFLEGGGGFKRISYFCFFILCGITEIIFNPNLMPVAVRIASASCWLWTYELRRRRTRAAAHRSSSSSRIMICQPWFRSGFSKLFPMEETLPTKTEK